MVSNPGNHVTDYDVAGLFNEAYLRTASMDKAVNGFKSTGKWPFNPDIFTDEEFALSEVTEFEAVAVETRHTSTLSLIQDRVPLNTHATAIS